MPDRLRAAIILATFLFATAAQGEEAALSGAQIYDAACASCHGVDGRGAPQGTAITVPLPDFTDCNFITREGDGNWRYLLAHGGAGLSLSPQMPAFGDVLSEEQLQAVLSYIRTFCHDPRWPRGELNFPRLLLTTKAFPEDEALLAPEFAKAPGTRDWTAELAFERRVGARGQIEAALPLALHDVTGGPTTGGVGDATLAYKHVLYADLPTRTIGGAELALVLPSGDQHRGLGDGTVSFEPSLLAGKQLGPLILQAQIRGDAPLDAQRADRAVHYRFGLSCPLSPLKRAWVPAVELEEVQNVTADHNTLFVTPQIYTGLTKRGHVAVAVGAQIPVTGDSDPLDVRVLAFLLWEYTDGGLWW
jgi:mono/diheme cytochrome c family protein